MVDCCGRLDPRPAIGFDISSSVFSSVAGLSLPRWARDRYGRQDPDALIVPGDRSSKPPTQMVLST